MTLVIASASLSQLIAALNNGRSSGRQWPVDVSRLWTDFVRKSIALFNPLARASHSVPYIDSTQLTSLWTVFQISQNVSVIAIWPEFYSTTHTVHVVGSYCKQAQIESCCVVTVWHAPAKFFNECVHAKESLFYPTTVGFYFFAIRLSH